jgi:hypothetical protein
MTLKKTKKKIDMMKSESKDLKKCFQIRLSESLYSDVKNYAGVSDISIADYVRESLAQRLRKDKARMKSIEAI